MMNIKAIFKRMTLGFVLAGVPLVGGCGSNTNSWQEEVKLLDGRVITITQKRRYENVYDGQSSGNLPREFWVTFKLPEFGEQEIVWHENLLPMILNVYQGKLYVIGVPWTELEFRQYGKPKPFYIGYRYESAQFVRIPFQEIPEPIYDTNLWIGIESPNGAKYISSALKKIKFDDERIVHELKRVDPNTAIH